MAETAIFPGKNDLVAFWLFRVQNLALDAVSGQLLIDGFCTRFSIHISKFEFRNMCSGWRL
jgi:hypothetical protein